MTRSKFRNLVVIQCFLLGAPSALAENSTTGILLIGFGSFGALTTTESQGLGDYGGRGRQLNLSAPLKLGLNASSKINETFGVRGQFSTSRHHNGSFIPHLDWGFVGWDALPWLQIRGGRIIAPIWANSQQIDVGFSYIWARPPIEVYGLYTIRSLNGGSVLVQSNLGPGYFGLDIFGGEGIHSFLASGDGAETTVQTLDTVGASASYSMLEESLVFGATYSQAHVNAYVDSPVSIDGAALGQTGVTLRVPFRTYVDASFGRFFSFSIKADFNGFLVFSEYARRKLNGLNYPDIQGAYVTLGYRLGDFTPHVTVAQRFGHKGNANYHPKFPSDGVTDPTIQEVKTQSLAYGLNFMPIDSVVFKFGASQVDMAFTEPTQNLDFWAFNLTGDFVF